MALQTSVYCTSYPPQPYRHSLLISIYYLCNTCLYLCHSFTDVHVYIFGPQVQSSQKSPKAPRADLCDMCKLVVNFLKPYVDSNATEVRVWEVKWCALIRVGNALSNHSELYTLPAQVTSNYDVTVST